MYYRRGQFRGEAGVSRGPAWLENRLGFRGFASVSAGSVQPPELHLQTVALPLGYEAAGGTSPGIVIGRRAPVNPPRLAETFARSRLPSSAIRRLHSSRAFEYPATVGFPCLR